MICSTKQICACFQLSLPMMDGHRHQRWQTISAPPLHIASQRVISEVPRAYIYYHSLCDSSPGIMGQQYTLICGRCEGLTESH